MAFAALWPISRWHCSCMLVPLILSFAVQINYVCVSTIFFYLTWKETARTVDAAQLVLMKFGRKDRPRL